ISPGYFRAAGTSMRAGRPFTWDDDAKATRVAIVNQTFSRRFFAAPDAGLGRFFKQRDGTRLEIVGIVEDGKYENLTEKPQPAIFLPVLQSRTPLTSLIVRTDGGPGALAPAMRAKLRGLDAELPSFIQPWVRSMELVMFPSKIAAMALGILGVMAALLSITGIFELAAYSVSRRLKEVGIRLALSADARDVLRATLARPVLLL